MPAGLNSKRDYRGSYASGLIREHRELVRQTWVLFMLNMRREWFDGKTIKSRSRELESFLERHLQNEEKKASFRDEPDIEALVAVSQCKTLLELLRNTSDQPPLTDKWSDLFQTFEITLSQHVGAEELRTQGELVRTAESVLTT